MTTPQTGPGATAITPSERLLPPEFWQLIVGTIIQDPDGWRCSIPDHGLPAQGWNVPITFGEFVIRAAPSTTGTWTGLKLAGLNPPMLASIVDLYAQHTSSRQAVRWGRADEAVRQIREVLATRDVAEIRLPYPNHPDARLIIRRVETSPAVVTFRIDPHTDVADQGYGLADLQAMLAFARKLEDVLPFTGYAVRLRRG